MRRGGGIGVGGKEGVGRKEREGRGGKECGREGMRERREEWGWEGNRGDAGDFGGASGRGVILSEARMTGKPLEGW